MTAQWQQRDPRPFAEPTDAELAERERLASMPRFEPYRASVPALRPPSAPPTTHPRASLVLVLGVISVCTCLPVGPAAWIIGHQARADIRAGRYLTSAELTTGYALGIISSLAIGLLVLMFLTLI